MISAGLSDHTLYVLLEILVAFDFKSATEKFPWSLASIIYVLVRTITGVPPFSVSLLDDFGTKI